MREPGPCHCGKTPSFLTSNRSDSWNSFKEYSAEISCCLKCSSRAYSEKEVRRRVVELWNKKLLAHATEQLIKAVKETLGNTAAYAYYEACKERTCVRSRANTANPKTPAVPDAAATK